MVVSQGARPRGERLALAATLLLAAAVWVMAGIRYSVRLQPLTGDEPYYVMTALSLLEDGDLDETNNYARGDWRRFYPPRPLPADWQGWSSFPWELPPHAAQAARPGLYSKHGLGLVLLIALPWAAWGRVGAMAVVGGFGLLLVAQLWLLAREAGARPWLASGLSLGFGLTMPIGPYALLLFPEVPAAFCLIYALRRLTERENAWWQWLLTGLVIGFLPWLHQRFLPSVALLGGVLFLRALLRWWAKESRVADRATAWVGVVPALLGGLGIVGYNLWLYRLPYQNPADHAGFHGFPAVLNTLAGLLLDAQWGLSIAAPVYLLALAALPVWRSLQPGRFWLTTAVVLPYLGLVAAYRVWWGEWGPPARYLVPVAGLAVGVLASWLSRANWWWKGVTLLVWSWGALLTLIGYADPQRFYHHPDGVNKLYRVLDRWLDTGFAGWLVAFQPYAAAPIRERFMAVLVLVVLWVGGVVLVRGSLGLRKEPPGRGEQAEVLVQSGGTRPTGRFAMVRWWRGKAFQPKEKVSQPSRAGAWVVTVRSTPLHYDELKRVIEGTGEARVYFGKPLAYLRGEAVALLRIEATGFGWLRDLWQWWQGAQRRDGISFDVRFYVQDREYVGSLRTLGVEELETVLQQRAPRVTAEGVAT